VFISPLYIHRAALTQDVIIMGGTLLQTVLNGILVSQTLKSNVLDRKRRVLEEQEREAKAAAAAAAAGAGGAAAEGEGARVPGFPALGLSPS
jgi:hypothetical protein